MPLACHKLATFSIKYATSMHERSLLPLMCLKFSYCIFLAYALKGLFYPLYAFSWNVLYRICLLYPSKLFSLCNMPLVGQMLFVCLKNALKGLFYSLYMIGWHAHYGICLLYASKKFFCGPNKL